MKQIAIDFLNFYRNSNWLHEFKSDEQLWEEFNKDREKGWRDSKTISPDYRTLYEREKALREAAEKVLESYANGVVNNLPDENYDKVIAYYQHLKQQYNGTSNTSNN